MIPRVCILEVRFPPRLPLLPPLVDGVVGISCFGIASGSFVDEGGDGTGF